jgi:hypothetical protein
MKRLVNIDTNHKIREYIDHSYRIHTETLLFGYTEVVSGRTSTMVAVTKRFPRVVFRNNEFPACYLRGLEGDCGIGGQWSTWFYTNQIQWRFRTRGMLSNHKRKLSDVVVLKIRPGPGAISWDYDLRGGVFGAI